MNKIVIQYQAHQVLTNKNSLTEMNRQLQKIEMTQPNNPEQIATQEQKVNLENLKRIMNGEKTTLPSLRNIEWWTFNTETKKIHQVLPYISTNNITELNEQICLGAKLVCEKIGILSKSTKKTSTTGWEILLETQIKKSTKTCQRKDAWTLRNKKENATQEKNNNTTSGNKPESPGERRKIKEISTKGKTIQTKQVIP